MSAGWIGVDLDGTLAEYHTWEGETSIGRPIPAMVDRVKRWLIEGRDVRIFTARLSGGSRPTDRGSVERAIRLWCAEHLDRVLPITNVKDFDMIELWDDRAVQVECNTGKVIGYSRRNLA